MLKKSLVLALLTLSFSVCFAETSAVDSLGLGWLRDTQSPDVQRWVEKQNEKSIAYVRKNSDGTDNDFYIKLISRMKEFNPTNAPLKIAGPFGELYVKSGGLVLKDKSGNEAVLAAKITPADGSGSSVIADFKVSPDQSRVAFAYIKNGGDINHWYVLNLSNQKIEIGPLDVRLNDFSWSLNSKGVYYTQCASREENAEGIFYARNMYVDLATSKQVFVFQAPDGRESKEFYSIAEILDSAGETQLIAHRVQGPAEIPLGVYVGHIDDTAKSQNYKWQTVRSPLSDRLGRFVTAEAGQIYLRSSEIGNNFGVVTVDINNHFKTATLIPAQKDQVMLFAQRVGNKLLLQLMDPKTFANIIKVYDLKGRLLKSFKMNSFGFGDMGVLSLFNGTPETEWSYFTYSTTLLPTTTFRLNTKTLDVEKVSSSAEINFDSSQVTTSLVFINSPDGLTKIPVEIYKRTDIATPKFVYLFYYGYIGTVQMGWWNRKYPAVLEMGGTVAVVHLRGGGERGRDGQLSVKNDRLLSVRETVAASRWLKKHEHVNKVVVSGRSFGGLQTMLNLVNASDEFDIFTPTVSVSDVNELLDRGLFGHFAADDFGIQRTNSGAELDNAQFRHQIATWSPLQNLSKLKSLKPVMIFTADTDERVEPQQSYFMAEALNRKFPGNNLVYLYQEPFNGHLGRTELYDEMGFIAKTLGITDLMFLKKTSSRD